MENEKRKPRSYKIADKNYRKALKRGNGKLATLIEQFVCFYGEGATIIDVSNEIPFGLIGKKKIKSTNHNKKPNGQ